MHAVARLEPRGCREPDRGRSADRGDHDIRRHELTVGEQHPRDGVAPDELAHLGPAAQNDAVLLVEASEIRPELRAELRHEGHLAAQQHGHIVPERARGRRDLHADPSGADDDDATPAVGDRGAQGVRLVDRAQQVHAREVPARHGQRMRCRARREQQLVVGERLAAREGHDARGPVDPGRRLPRAEPDVALRVPAEGVHVERAALVVPREVALRERRSDVGRVWLRPHESHLAREPAGPQLGAGSRPGEARTDDDDAFSGHAARLRRSPPPRPAAGPRAGVDSPRLIFQVTFRKLSEIMGRMSDGPKILIVDDEPNIRDLLTTSLRFAGFAVRAVGNGAQAISAVLDEEPDLIILDVMLPDMNGFGVTKRLRASGYTAPILFLTAKDDTEDKITGLTVGGDDYVTKPFSLDEIVARIKAILRRTMQDEEDAIIRAGELTMDQDTHEVTVGDVPVELSPTEFKLLRYLMLNPNRVLSKAQILDHVWEYDFNGDAGIVESYISYLRRKIDQHSSEPMIQTKRGFGYMLKTAKA